MNTLWIGNVFQNSKNKLIVNSALVAQWITRQPSKLKIVGSIPT